MNIDSVQEEVCEDPANGLNILIIHGCDHSEVEAVKQLLAGQTELTVKDRS